MGMSKGLGADTSQVDGKIRPPHKALAFFFFFFFFFQ
jgi:hypothetical protein